MLQNYLQSAIGELSFVKYSLSGTEIPLTVTLAATLVIVLLITLRKKLTFNRIIGWIIIIFLFWVGQKSTDYYFNHEYYELQYNWHYFAYSIFAFLNYRALKDKNASDSKIIKYTFVIALLTSTFDEAIQIPLSSRIFDIGDISKDVWGVMIGIFFVYFILRNGDILKGNWKIRERKLKDYFKNPFSLLVFEFILAYIFMVTASILTDTTFSLSATFISLLIFTIVFLIIHLSQFKIPRIIIISSGIAIVGVLVFSSIANRNSGLKYINNHTLLYKGLPLYYFDIMIFPDGMVRPVDKKEVFYVRDQQTILDHTDDILIIASGSEGQGGKGFPQDKTTQFVYNTKKNKGQQVIILKNEQAIMKYNQLVSENKKPTLIYHNN